jgi:hypothetical protein
MISKPALLTVEKDKRKNLSFVCSTTPGWLWGYAALKGRSTHEGI